MSDLNKPEPPPMVMAGTPETWELVIQDMRERDRLGRAKYHTPLRPHNGRNSLVDAYQEVLDLAVYLRNEIEEKRRQSDRGEQLRLLAEAVIRLKTHYSYIDKPHTPSSRAGQDWSTMDFLIGMAEAALREIGE